MVFTAGAVKMDLSYQSFVDSVSGGIVDSLKNNKYVLLIGKNGRGKSGILANLADTLPLNGINTLAISFSITDKFPYSTKRKNYIYLGVRSTSNSTQTNTLDNKIFDNLIAGSNNFGFADKIERICSFLEVSPEFHIWGELHGGSVENIDEMDDYVLSAVTARRGRGRVALDEIKTTEARRSAVDGLFEEEAISRSDVAQLLEELQSTDLKFQRRFDLRNILQMRIYSVIPALRKLGVIKNFSLSVGRSTSSGLNFMSSGQKNIFFTLTQVCRHAGLTSIVLIDEPEISLHPDWQARYIPLLEDLFGSEDFRYVIATHSPFVAINCFHSQTSVISLTRSQSGFAWERINSMEGWSVDIASVDGFNVGSYRSTRLEQIMLDACEVISAESPLNSEVTYYLKKLSEYSLAKDDPINLIIQDLERLKK